MNEKKTVLPPVDIYETPDEFVMVLDMPGAEKDSIDISIAGETLTVSARAAEVGQEWKSILSEFSVSDYKREFSIGHRVNSDQVEARYEAGILTLKLGKSEQAKSRKIDVKAA